MQSAPVQFTPASVYSFAELPKHLRDDINEYMCGFAAATLDPRWPNIPRTLTSTLNGVQLKLITYGIAPVHQAHRGLVSVLWKMGTATPEKTGIPLGYIPLGSQLCSACGYGQVQSYVRNPKQLFCHTCQPDSIGGA